MASWSSSRWSEMTSESDIWPGRVLRHGDDGAPDERRLDVRHVGAAEGLEHLRRLVLGRVVGHRDVLADVLPLAGRQVDAVVAFGAEPSPARAHHRVGPQRRRVALDLGDPGHPPGHALRDGPERCRSRC